MMRKIHRVAMASALKSAFATFTPAFLPAKAEFAKLAECERRFCFASAYASGMAFLIFEPSATARDNYFTVDLAWLRSGRTKEDVGVVDALAVAVLAPWRVMAPDDLLARPCFRLRIDELWNDSPAEYRGSFSFSTASSRYSECMFSLATLPEEERSNKAFELLTGCMAEEKELAPEQALAELSPALSLSLDAVRQAALPAFARADFLATV